MTKKPHSRPHWKKTALHVAVLSSVASGFMANEAQAIQACDSTVNSSMTSQCVMQPNADTLQTVNSGVSIAVTDGSAVLYQGDLGNTEGEHSGSLTNNGTISSSVTTSGSVAGAIGVEIQGELLGTLTNNLSISGSASDSEGYANAYGIIERGAPNMSGSLTNTGIISATATAGSSAGATGFSIENNMSGTLTNENTGTISAAATATSHHAFAGGIIVGDEMSGTITNRGLISASAQEGEGGHAVGIYAGTVTTIGAISNTGTIQSRIVADGGEGLAAGIEVDHFGGTLNNSGVIAGDGQGLYAAGYSLYLQNQPSATGTVNNSSTGRLIGGLYASGNINVSNAGQIILKNGVDITDATTIRDTGGVAFGYISGNYTQTDTGVLHIYAENDDSEGGYSRLNVHGTADIAGKAFVDVKEANTLAVGQTLSGVVSAGTLSGNFSRVDDNSALFNFESVVRQDEERGYIDFNLVKALTVLDANTSVNNTPGNNAARVLDTVIDDPVLGNSPAWAPIITALGQLQTEQEVANAVSQTLPLMTGGSQVAASAALTGINRVVQARQEANRGLSSGDTFYGDKKIWMKPFGSWADQNDRKGISGYKVKTGGLAFGVDGTTSDTTRLGASFAYAKASADSNSSVAPNSTNIDVFQLIGYGSHALDKDTELNFQVGIGQNNNEGTRRLTAFGLTAKADYTSFTATAGVGLGKIFKTSDTTSFTPSIRADYSWVKDKGYTESGAGALNLNVNSRTTNELILAVDGKVAHELNKGTTLTANLGLGYDVLSEQASVTSAFAGAPGAAFTTKGLDPSPWMARGGLGVVNTMAGGAEISVRYDAEYRKDFLNQTASVKVRWAF